MLKNSRVLLLLTLLSVLPFRSLAQSQQLEIENGVSASEAEHAELNIAQLLEQFNVPGVSIAVIRDFQIHWAQGYGMADIVADRPVDTRTLFQAASISKPVNAMAVLKAAEEGLFSMDQDINEILGSWQLPATEHTENIPVTPRSLSAHVAGLGDGFGFPGYSPGAPLPTLPQIFEGQEPSNVGPMLMARPPMTAYHYSGGGVTVLQQALLDSYQRQDYASLLREKVLDPIGMADSSFEQPLPESLHEQAARAHSFSGGANSDVWHVYPEQAAAGLWTTPTDLAKFAIEVQKSYHGESNLVLSRESVADMVNPVGVGPFGVGFQVAKSGEGWYFSHGGSNFGFQAQLTAHKLHGYGYAIMTNAPGGYQLIQELARRIEAAYGFDTLAEPVRR